MGIYEKLLKIRRNVDYIQKTETGNQGAKYADPAVLLKKIRDKMNDLSVILTPSLTNSTITTSPMPTKNNPENNGYIFQSDGVYTFVDCETGEKHENQWFFCGSHRDDAAMAGGAALTYFERYFLLKFFQIPTSKDDPEHFKQKTTEPEFISEEQHAQLEEMIESTGTNMKEFCKWAKVKELSMLQVQFYDTCLNALKAKARKK